MKESNNEVLSNILEQLCDIVAVSEEIISYIENSEIGKNIHQIQTEISLLLEKGASKEWYELVNLAFQKEDSPLWIYEIVEAFKEEAASSFVREALEESQSVRKFSECLEKNISNDSDLEKSKEKKEDYAGNTIDIIGDYMDQQTEVPLGEIGKVDQLIALAVYARDALKEYTNQIHTLEKMVHSQKQLLENQRKQIEQQKATITEQQESMERYESQLERVNRQYSDMNQTLLRLNDIQTELRMIGKES